MRKALTKILLISMILVWFGNLNGANAGWWENYDECEEKYYFTTSMQTNPEYYKNIESMYSNYYKQINNFIEKIEKKNISDNDKKKILESINKKVDNIRNKTWVNIIIRDKKEVSEQKYKLYLILWYLEEKISDSITELNISECRNDVNLWVNYSLDNFLKNSKEDIISIDFNEYENINSCDYESKYWCERNSPLEYFAEKFYLNIKNFKIEEAIKIAKENPWILELWFRWIDIRSLNWEVYILEIGQERGYISFSNITFSNNKIIIKRNWIDLNRIYWERSTEENFNKIYPLIKSDFHKIKIESPIY